MYEHIDLRDIELGYALSGAHPSLSENFHFYQKKSMGRQNIVCTFSTLQNVFSISPHVSGYCSSGRQIIGLLISVKRFKTLSKLVFIFIILQP